MRKLVFKVGIIFLVITNGLVFNHIFSCFNEVDFENAVQNPAIVETSISYSKSLVYSVLFFNVLVISGLVIFHFKTKTTKDKH